MRYMNEFDLNSSLRVRSVTDAELGMGKYIYHKQRKMTTVETWTVRKTQKLFFYNPNRFQIISKQTCLVKMSIFN